MRTPPAPVPAGFYADLCIRNLSTIERERAIYAARLVSLHRIDDPAITLGSDDYREVAQ